MQQKDPNVHVIKDGTPLGDVVQKATPAQALAGMDAPLHQVGPGAPISRVDMPVAPPTPVKTTSVDEHGHTIVQRPVPPPSREVDEHGHVIVRRPAVETVEDATSGYVEIAENAEAGSGPKVGITSTPVATAEAIKTATEMAEQADETDDEKNAKDYAGFIKLPYIELYTRRTRVINDIEELKSSKAMIDQIGDTFREAERNPDSEAAKIAAANGLDKAAYKKSASDFYKDYPRLLHDAMRLRSLMDAMLETYPAELRHSTSFVSKSMVESSKIRRDRMEAADPKPMNYDMVLKRLDTVTAAYEDRTNFDPIFQKLQYPHNIRKVYKEFTGKDPKEAMAEVDRIFMPVFSDNHMSKFRQALADTIMTDKMDANNTKVLIFFMTYWLAKVYEQEFTSGKCSYVKTFIMNFYDIASKMYDCKYGVGFMAMTGQTMFSLIAYAATADVTTKQLSNKYAEMYAALVSVLEMNRKASETIDTELDIPDSTTLEAMYPNLDYTLFREEREIIEGAGDTESDITAGEPVVTANELQAPETPAN